MQVTLFKALKSINLDDGTATVVVDQLEDHIAMKISEANKGLEAATKGLEIKLDATAKALEAQIKALTWLVGSFGALIAIMGAVATFGPPIQKMLGH